MIQNKEIKESKDKNVLNNNNNIVQNNYHLGVKNNHPINQNAINNQQLQRPNSAKIIQANVNVLPNNILNNYNNKAIINKVAPVYQAQQVNQNIHNILLNKNIPQQKNVASRPQSAKVPGQDKMLINQLNQVNQVNQLKKNQERQASPVQRKVVNNPLGNHPINKSPRSKSPLPVPSNILKRPVSSNQPNVVSRPQSGREQPGVIQNKIINSDKKPNHPQLDKKYLINPIKIAEQQKNIIKLPQNNYHYQNNQNLQINNNLNRNNFLNAVKIPENKLIVNNNGPKIVYINQHKKL